MIISLVIAAIIVALILFIVFIVAFFSPASCNHQWEITDMGAFIEHSPAFFGPHTERPVHKYSKLCKTCAQHQVYYL